MRPAPLLATGWLMLCLAVPVWSQSRASGSNSDPDLPSLLATYPDHHTLGTLLRGFDAGMTFTSAHDSFTGWYTLATPGLSYAVSPRLSFDVATPIYLRHNSYGDKGSRSGSAGASPMQTQPAGSDAALSGNYAGQFAAHTWDPGDTFVSAHLTLAPRHAFYTLTPSLVLPTGDTRTGLSTGRTTFDIDQHFELPLARLVPSVDIGAGDSSSAVNHLVTRDDTSSGSIAHFQLGIAAPLAMPVLRSRQMLFSSFAYEQLPLGGNTYATRTLPGGMTQTVLTGHHATEDNGFTNSLTIPLSPRVTVAGYYNRSLRLHLDTAAVSLQFSLRRRHTAPGVQDDGAASLLRDAVR